MKSVLDSLNKTTLEETKIYKDLKKVVENAMQNLKLKKFDLNHEQYADELNNILIKPLECVIDQELDYIYDSRNVLTDRITISGLKNNPLHLNNRCLNRFDGHDIVYGCLECEVDPTCSLCSDCFRESDHTDHNYRFNRGGNGGICDCGDPEAWKNFPNCKNHEINKIETEHDDETTEIFLDVIKRYFAVFLENCVDSLFYNGSSKFHMPIPSFKIKKGLYNSSNERKYCFNIDQSISNNVYNIVMYNDEHHDFNDVIEILSPAFHNYTNASKIATMINYYGYCSIYQTSNYANISTVLISLTESSKSIVNHKSEDLGTLNYELLEHNVLKMNMILSSLLEFMSKLTDLHPKLITVIYKVLFTKNKVHDIIYMDFFFEEPKYRWSGLRRICHNFLYKVCFSLEDYRVDFSLYYVTKFKNMFENYMVDSCKISNSVISLFLQIFTTKSCVAKFLQDEDFTRDFIKKSFAFLIELSHNDKSEFRYQHEYVSVENHFYWKSFDIFEQISYAINSICLIENLDTEIYAGAANFLYHFVDTVNTLTAAFGETKLITRHKYEDENTYLFQFIVTGRVFDAMDNFAYSMRTYRNTTFHFFYSIMFIIEKNQKDLLHSRTYERLITHTTINIFGKNITTYTLTPCDLVYNVFSFTSRKVVSCLKVMHDCMGMTIKDIWKDHKHLKNDFIDSYLDIIAVIIEIYSGKWVHNGMNTKFYKKHYKNAIYITLFRSDLDLLRFAFFKKNQDVVLWKLFLKLNLFSGLWDIFEGEGTYSLDGLSEYEFFERDEKVIEQLYAWILFMFTENITNDTHVIDSHDVVKRYLINLLIGVTNDKRFVFLYAKSYFGSNISNGHLSDVLDEIATMNSIGAYNVKPKFHHLCDDMSFFSTKIDAVVHNPTETIKHMKKLEKVDTLITLPEMPLLVDRYSHLYNILTTNSLFLLYYHTFKSNLLYSSIACRALRLLILSLRDKPHSENDIKFLHDECCSASLYKILCKCENMEHLGAEAKKLLRYTLSLYHVRFPEYFDLKDDNYVLRDFPKEKLNIDVDSKISHNCVENSEQQSFKDKARLARENVMKNFQSQQKNFIASLSKDEIDSLNKSSVNSLVNCTFQEKLICYMCYSQECENEAMIVFGHLTSRIVNQYDSFDSIFLEEDGTNWCRPVSHVISTCGHSMHYKCFKKATSNLNHTAQVYLSHFRLDHVKSDCFYVCPFCASFNNILLPIFGDVIHYNLGNWQDVYDELKNRRLLSKSILFQHCLDLDDWFFLSTIPSCLSYSIDLYIDCHLDPENLKLKSYDYRMTKLIIPTLIYAFKFFNKYNNKCSVSVVQYDSLNDFIDILFKPGLNLVTNSMIFELTTLIHLRVKLSKTNISKIINFITVLTFLRTCLNETVRENLGYPVFNHRKQGLTIYISDIIDTIISNTKIINYMESILSKVVKICSIFSHCQKLYSITDINKVDDFMFKYNINSLHGCFKLLKAGNFNGWIIRYQNFIDTNTDTLNFINTPKRMKLTQLPEMYEELLHLTANYKCPTLKIKISNIFICLQCSEIICGENACCQTQISEQLDQFRVDKEMGPLNYHSRFCFGENSLFLNVTNRHILHISRKYKVAVYGECLYKEHYINERKRYKIDTKILEELHLKLLCVSPFDIVMNKCLQVTMPRFFHSGRTFINL